jgi:ABC-type antimicrobial peptide transport system permease subunit
MKMFKNYLLIALRNIKRYKAYSMINITGLAVGMACCILIFLWVQDELNFDRFHKYADDLYRVISEKHVADQVSHNATTPNPIGPTLVEDYPEIINFTRTQIWKGWLVRYGKKKFLNDTLAVADPSFFEVFTFPFLKGDPKIAFDDRYSVVITEETAKKYFAHQEPMGKYLKIMEQDFKVTGVLKKAPPNSHIQFDCIFPIINMQRMWHLEFENWAHDHRFYTYVQLGKDISIKDIGQKISGIVKRYHPQSNISGIYLQPLTDIHLRSAFKGDNDNYKQGNITRVYILSLIALCLLLVACINFMNLSTARSVTRSGEVGFRKVIGASRVDLIKQFLGESLILSFIAFFISIILALLFLPVFNQLTDKQLTLTAGLSGDIRLIFGFIGIALFTGIAAGSYPAFFLSSFQPVRTLKGIGGAVGQHGSFLRKVMVVSQFVFTTILIAGTAIIYYQLRFIENRDLGYDKDNLIYFSGDHKYDKDYEAKKNELLKHSDILSVTKNLPPIYIEDSTEKVKWEGQKNHEKIAIHPVNVDYDYIKTFNMKMAAGRYFSEEFSTDTSNYILNETAVKMMGMESPLGKRFWLDDQGGTIIGVIKDYHHGSLHQQIEPLVFKLFHRESHWLSIKLNPANMSEALTFLESKWQQLSPVMPFSYMFFDEKINSLYKAEKKVGVVAKVFTFLAIFVSCIGLFGLASYMAEKRTKEIGVRKVLGASVPGIVNLLIKDFLKLVLIAVVIASPLGWYIMYRWLQNFVYRIGIELWIFLYAGGALLVITLFAISYQAIAASLKNPSESLRYE